MDHLSLNPNFVLPHKTSLLSVAFRAMDGRVEFSTELTKKRMLQRLPHVALTWTARVSWLDGVVITQHRTLTCKNYVSCFDDGFCVAFHFIKKI